MRLSTHATPRVVACAEGAEGAEGADRARNASEAFLFRRLETLPETVGRFRLNATLPIPFNGFGEMEVDLPCDSARVAVEIDGARHLADEDAMMDFPIISEDFQAHL